MVYLIPKLTIIPVVKLYFRKINGIENIPKKGTFIAAANHASYIDHLIIAGSIISNFNRKVHFLAKKEHFDNPLKAAWHTYAGAIPLDRQKGGKEALQNYTEDVQQALDENNITLLQKTLQPYVQLIAKTKDWHIVDGYLALHAGLLEEQYTQKRLVFQERNFFLRPQEIPQKKKYLNQCVLVAGHTYMGDSPTIEKGYINIDLGAGYGKHIGALSVTEHKIIRSDGTAFYIDSSTK